MDNLTLSLFTGIYFGVLGALPLYGVFTVLKQPIFVGTIIGFMTGDLKTAVIASAYLEIIYLGLNSSGENDFSDELVAALFCIPLILKSNLDFSGFISLGFIIGILGKYLNKLRLKVNTRLINIAEKYIYLGNGKTILKYALVFPLIIGFILRFPFMFLLNYLSLEFIYSSNLVSAEIFKIFVVIAKVLPALGFAVYLLNARKNKYFPLFVIGFFLVKYLNLNINAALIFGICISILIVNLKTKEGN